jgi:hypothetical protein
MMLRGLKLLKQPFEKFWEALINAVSSNGVNDANFKFSVCAFSHLAVTYLMLYLKDGIQEN